jgi:predicted nucleotidyltransferase
MEHKRRITDLDTPSIQAYLARQPDIVIAYLFGSVARGEENRLSDVDIAILLEPDLNRETQLEVQIKYLTELDQMICRDVQLVILNDAPPMLAYQVIRDGLLLYERSQEERVEFAVLAIKRYFDVQPMMAYFNQALIQRIKEEGLGQRKRSPKGALEAARRIHERLASVSGS